jgi:hypothetical protein
MNLIDRHVCIAASFNHNDARLFLFDWNIRLSNELLTGRRQGELGECFGQRVRLLLGQEKNGASEWIATVFDGRALRLDLVDRQGSDGDAG